MLLIILVLVPMILILGYLAYVISKQTVSLGIFYRILELLSILILPLIFLTYDNGTTNECCFDSAAFSPIHRPTIHFLYLICIVAYFYSSYRKSLAPPLAEIMINSVLVIGIVFNILVAYHLGEGWMLANFPIIFFFFTNILINHNKILSELKLLGERQSNALPAFCLRLLSANIFLKYPIFLVLAIPVLILVASIMFLFGQKPEAMVKAFTETYKHGFSQLDYMCDNVHCGGHYLCSVAANGHPAIVKPVRYGERNGARIICNRQLLVANAFEQLLEEKCPAAHRIIRKNYDHVGDKVHKYYKVFNNKFFSDLIYILMKPFEWSFLGVLYLCDKKPENRIAQQYINKNSKQKLERNFF